MLRFVTLFSVLALALAQHNIFQLDLDPEEAAKYINNPPFAQPALAPRTAVLPLVRYDSPNFRTAEAGPSLGHYWKNGKEIENTNDYLEEVYNARQYHGQDGLGAYAYGYETPESSKTEAKQRSGDLQGTYTYKAGTGNNLITVRYWQDGEGFHQEDNLPKYVPKPVEEASEVRAARIAHEKAWNEAAYANLHPGAPAANTANQAAPQPNYNYQSYNPGEYQGGASGQYNTFALPPSQLRVTRQAGRYEQPDYKQTEFNKYQNEGYSTTTTTTPPPDPTGPPRGFFYSFDYPVNIIVPKSEAGGSVQSGYPLDSDTFVQGQNQK